jgi:U4/U6.U5 tri-snRNP component SNU23
MRTERADVSKVQDRLGLLKQKIEEKKNRPTMSSIDSYESRIAAQVAEQEMKKKQRKEEREKQKEIERALQEDEDDEEQDGPSIAEMMGFGGFGSSKK